MTYSHSKRTKGMLSTHSQPKPRKKIDWLDLCVDVIVMAALLALMLLVVYIIFATAPAIMTMP